MNRSKLTDGFVLRAIIERHLSWLDEELFSDEVEDCIEFVSNSLLPIKDILQRIADNHLPSLVSRTALQTIANAFQPLFEYESSPEIYIEPEVRVFINGKKRVANAANGWDDTDKQGIRFSRRFLDSCRDLPGKWIGTLLHELTHEHVSNTFAKRKNYKPRRNGHDVFFFNKAFAIEVQLELVLSEWTSLRSIYGPMGLNLETTRKRNRDLDRHYDWHLKKARDEMEGRIFAEVGWFLLSTTEQRRLRRETSSLQFRLPDDDYEDPTYGDVIFYPQLLEQMMRGYV